MYNILVRNTAYKSPVRTGERRKYGRDDQRRNAEIFEQRS